MAESNLEERTDHDIQSLQGRARSDLLSDKKELSDLVEKGLSQPDERVIALRARIQHDQLVLDEMERIQKDREQKRDH